MAEVYVKNTGLTDIVVLFGEDEAAWELRPTQDVTFLIEPGERMIIEEQIPD